MSGGASLLRPAISKITGVAFGLAAAATVGGDPLHPAVFLTFVVVTAAVRLALGMAWERS